MSFTNIIGQDRAVHVLKVIIEHNEAAGAYLFTGPDGIGKAMTAIEFAKALNCEKNQTDACDECASCKKIRSGNHPDVFIVEPREDSRVIKIDEIRDIIYATSLKPYEGRTKIFILRDAERMTEESSNALLKVLEEPPQNQVFILTTCRISAMLPTIISRCRVLRFNILDREDSRRLLIERHNFSDEEAVLFSHLAMGSPGIAIHFKEENLLKQRDQVLNDFFFRKRALFSEDILDEKKYIDTEDVLFILLCWYRDMLVSKLNASKDIFLNADKEEGIVSYANGFSQKELENNIMAIIKTMGYIRRNVNPKMALFNMILELARR